jgi:8-oxo-dGTP pyrophosphatase MutT (NUDIX family)
MMTELDDFLSRYTPDSTEQEVWGGLPLAWVTSVRCILRRDDEVLVLQNPDGYRLLPGGRREPDEPLLETLRRELLEETGWTIQPPRLLGFLHLHHLAPKPPDYPYPHPDFMQVVYGAHVDTFHLEAKLPDDYEAHAEFRPVAEMRALPLPKRDRLFLEAITAER